MNSPDILPRGIQDLILPEHVTRHTHCGQFTSRVFTCTGIFSSGSLSKEIAH